MTFPGVSLRPHLAFNPRHRRLSTPLLTPFNSTPISSLVWNDPKSVIGYGVRGGSLGARGGGETLTLERFDLGVTAFGSAIPLAREANFKWRTVSLQDKGPGKHKPRERKPLGSSFF
jgi:hypothetical protein